jgi:hypothetical protein
MALEYANGATSGVLRLRTYDGGWTPVHVTINRVELEPDTFAALMTLRVPTDDELAVMQFAETEEAASPDKKSRKGKKNKKDKKKSEDDG